MRIHPTNKERNINWKDPEQRNAYKKIWRQENRVHYLRQHREQQLKQYHKNKKEILKRQREWWAENLEKARK